MTLTMCRSNVSSLKCLLSLLALKLFLKYCDIVSKWQNKIKKGRFIVLPTGLDQISYSISHKLNLSKFQPFFLFDLTIKFCLSSLSFICSSHADLKLEAWLENGVTTFEQSLYWIIVVAIFMITFFIFMIISSNDLSMIFYGNVLNFENIIICN